MTRILLRLASALTHTHTDRLCTHTKKVCDNILQLEYEVQKQDEWTGLRGARRTAAAERDCGLSTLAQPVEAEEDVEC